MVNPPDATGSSYPPREVALAANVPERQVLALIRDASRVSHQEKVLWPSAA